jgi:hypothetical protein
VQVTGTTTHSQLPCHLHGRAGTAWVASLHDKPRPLFHFLGIRSPWDGRSARSTDMQQGTARQLVVSLPAWPGTYLERGTAAEPRLVRLLSVGRQPGLFRLGGVAEDLMSLVFTGGRCGSVPTSHIQRYMAAGGTYFYGWRAGHGTTWRGEVWRALVGRGKARQAYLNNGRGPIRAAPFCVCRV